MRKKRVKLHANVFQDFSERPAIRDAHGEQQGQHRMDRLPGSVPLIIFSS